MKRFKKITIKDLKKIGNITHLNLIWKAIMEMDNIFLEDLLVENIIYKNIDKYLIEKKEFIKDINSLFEKHQAMGDKELLLGFDICESYNTKKPVCKFIGNESKNTFSLDFEIKGKRVIKIHQCFKLFDNFKLYDNDDIPF